MNAVQLDAVEAQLRALWAEAARAAKGLDEPLLRASVVNLVVVIEGRGALPEVSRILVRVAADYPGRMIVLVPEPLAGAEGVEARVSLYCRASGPASGARQVCCEQITLEVKGTAVGALPSIVRPLLSADLPVVVWWRAPVAAEASLLDRLAPEAQLVVVDTARGAVAADGVTAGGDPLAAASGLLARRAFRRGRWSLRDLAFSRLAPWLELTAVLFDLAACRRMLDRVESVSVTGRPESSGLRLYVGWLASRLGWPAAGPGSPVRVVPAEEGAPLVRVTFEGPGVRASVRLGEATPAGETLEASAAIDGAPPLSRVVTLPAQDEARLVAGELAAAGDDPVYEAAVQGALR